LRAPFTGTVTGICCSAGQRVVGYESATATPLLVIENFKQVYAYATIPERFISQVTPDMPARARVGAYPLEHFPLAIFPGKVVSISPTVDPQTRTFDIRVLLENADNRLRSGMSVEVGLIMEHYDKVLLVAKEAVVKGELQTGLDLVFVVDDAEKAAAGEPVRVTARAVDLGPGDGVNYILNEKIDAAGGREKLATTLLGRDLEGSLVVTAGAASLVDGQLVKVVR
jgi:membrane fusion protein (multidrug efflux system)